MLFHERHTHMCVGCYWMDESGIKIKFYCALFKLDDTNSTKQHIAMSWAINSFVE